MFFSWLHQDLVLIWLSATLLSKQNSWYCQIDPDLGRFIWRSCILWLWGVTWAFTSCKMLCHSGFGGLIYIWILFLRSILWLWVTGVLGSKEKGGGVVVMNMGLWMEYLAAVEWIPVTIEWSYGEPCLVSIELLCLCVSLSLSFSSHRMNHNSLIESAKNSLVPMNKPSEVT